MDEKQKILLCGDVEGKFEALFKRVLSIEKKSGPFHCLICVGNFFGINNKEFDSYRLGEKKGKRGLYTDSKGIKIAYLSGISGTESNDYSYSNQDVVELYNSCVRGNTNFKGVDILLTSQWPDGVMNNDQKKVLLTVNKSNILPSWLLMKLKPRYHVSGLEGVFYESAPFRCPNLGEIDASLEIVTRFIGLARVGNYQKQKWLYALNLTPLDKMRMTELLQKTIDERDCPLNFEDIDHKIFQTKRKSMSSNQYFYDMNAPAEKSKNKRPKREKIEFDQSKCWFCLASPSVEKHLIVNVANSTYLAIPKGGLVDEHFLVCPIEHHQNILGLPQDIMAEIDHFKDALQKFFARKETVPVFFERNYKTSHMQLQAVPIPKHATKELKKIFLEEAEAQGLKLEQLDPNNRLDQVLQANVPYFTVELPDETILYTKIKGHFPLNFGREVLATGAILNLPDKVDWKDCVLKKVDEERLVQELRSSFEPFSFGD